MREQELRDQDRNNAPTIAATLIPIRDATWTPPDRALRLSCAEILAGHRRGRAHQSHRRPGNQSEAAPHSRRRTLPALRRCAGSEPMNRSSITPAMFIAIPCKPAGSPNRNSARMIAPIGLPGHRLAESGRRARPLSSIQSAYRRDDADSRTRSRWRRRACRAPEGDRNPG